jgi:hypothetical protein
VDLKINNQKEKDLIIKAHERYRNVKVSQKKLKKNQFSEIHKISSPEMTVEKPVINTAEGSFLSLNEEIQ